MAYRILVVDDEPDLQALITQRFRKRIRTDELSFQFAGNGEEALSKLASDGNLDVVLTDINMPVMDGLTLLSRLKEAHPLLRSVIVSAYGDMQNIRTALNRGAFDFITKPIDFQDLEITLDKAIGDATSRKQAASDRDRLLRIHRELELARGIQESLVPQNFPRDPRLDIFGTMIPAQQVGGDLFDCFLLDPSRLAVTIGDVSGKGIAAALYMAVARTFLRVAAHKGLPPNECLLEANQFLRAEHKASGTFLTCFYGILDLTTGILQYSRAGHNPPYLVRTAQSGSLETLEATGGLPLGVFKNVEYGNASVVLHPGDTLLLFTDGITEAMDPSAQLYSDARLAELLHTRGLDLPATSLVRLVTQEAIAFSRGAPATDDMTVLAVRYQPRS